MNPVVKSHRYAILSISGCKWLEIRLISNLENDEKYSHPEHE